MIKEKHIYFIYDDFIHDLYILYLFLKKTVDISAKLFYYIYSKTYKYFYQWNVCINNMHFYFNNA